jgi:hypothetical protein
MPEEAVQLKGVPEPLQQPIREYSDLLRSLGGAKAKSLTLFGAVAAGRFDAARHTMRSVLVVESVDLGMLRRLSEHGPKLGKRRIAAPLIMTPAYIENSLDTFPLELIEIQQNHITVFGEDPFKALTFEDAHVRHQCEREFKTILIGLRQGLLAAAGKDKVLESVQVEAAEELIRTLRGMLWLKGQKDGKPAEQVVAEIEKSFERKLDGVRAVLNPSGPHGWNEFQALYRDVAALAEKADAA